MNKYFIVVYFALILLLSGCSIYSPAESCTSDFFEGAIDISTLKKQCPNLEKENLIDAVNNDFENSNMKPYTSHQEMLRNIENNY